MRDAEAASVRREDYRPPPYTIEHLDLDLDLFDQDTRVIAVSRVRRTAHSTPDAPLVLDGQAMTLVSVTLDDRPLLPDEYTLTDDTLTVPGVPESFTLRVEGHVNPEANKALEGLYLSGGNFCTQCEAEGFRRITWFLDRPDVMARYRVTLRACSERFPVLLANGNRVDQGSLPDGRHYATWEDPFPKPCYLFAVVAGDLACRTGSFRTASGREVQLEVYVDPADLEQTEYCLQSLQRAMAWDERTFGREYDLNTYMIVAVRDFNMGAMENKGLNIFNTKYVLAHPATATDHDFASVESVVAHEYFHNWSGNRVTCRDWFQLSLKEGFTVYRDQEFSADLGSRALQRIQDVQRLLAVQFPEDTGPTAHPVRPDTYQEINNFYTATIYEKGAEVVRMIHTLVGAEPFRRGSDLYFERFDGQAVTCEDFVCAMEEASGRDLSQFRLWYSQAGTPRVHAEQHYDSQARNCSLTLRQELDPTPDQERKLPMLIPIRVGLLATDGRPLSFTSEADGPRRQEHVLELTQAEQTFVLQGVQEPPIPSLLREFSAPVRLQQESPDAHMLVRMAHDPDPFNRWEASQALAQQRIFHALQRLEEGKSPLPLDEALIAAAGNALRSESDPALLAETLQLPSETVLGDRLPQVDPALLYRARQHVRSELARQLEAPLRKRYQTLSQVAGDDRGPRAMGQRALRNMCLDYLMPLEPEGTCETAWQQFDSARNMTESVAALAQICRVPGERRDQAVALFRERYQRFPLVIDKWFAVQAISDAPDTLDRVRALADHPQFDIHNPNRVRSLVSSLAAGNPRHFHGHDGAGYQMLAEYVLRIDTFNPQVAARMVAPLCAFARYIPPLRQGMLEALERIAAAEGLSRDVREQVSRSLQAAKP